MKSNEETLTKLKKELLRIGSTNQADYDLLKMKGNLSSSQICRRIGASWREIIVKIDLKPARVLLSKDEMLKALKVEFERIGSFKKEVYREHRNKKQFPFPRILTEHLGMSWVEIIKECGCTDAKEKATNDVTDESLIYEYIKICKDLGKQASVKELEKLTEYSFEIYRQHFGSMTGIRKACGFIVKANSATPPIITKDDCKKELKAIYNKHGRVSFSQLKEISTISISTIFRRFHTTKINDIWDEVLRSKKVENTYLSNDSEG